MILLIIFLAILGWFIWQGLTHRARPLDDVWLAESDPRRDPNWRRI